MDAWRRSRPCAASARTSNAAAPGIAVLETVTPLAGSNVLVDSNIVHDTNQAPLGDSGCIYNTDNHVNLGVGITNNIVYNCLGKGIYLDNNTSFVTLVNNIIYGTNQFCWIIHGGDHDLFKNNICDTTNFAAIGANPTVAFLYQDVSGNSGTNFGMNYNNIMDNIIYSGNNSQPVPVWQTSSAYVTAPPIVSKNIYYAASGTAFTNPNMLAGSTFTVTDTAPFFGSPQFTNAAAHDYSFTGTYANDNIGFVPINTANIGP
jgi:hypothetical protein